uniref:Uncharacterized protein n=1 Tax=Streptomyces venezuelae TaxID=54571 RepID=Q3LAI9_STRVZ|nr:hypothetical protein [Streptomyces venezuelae]CAJ32332.1 hypothetical protein [Streptomyces venezuelae]
MTTITTTDRRRWQYAALDVLGTITADAAELPPLTWHVATTAQLQGEPDSGAPADRLATLKQWSRHLDIDLTERPGPDGVVTYNGHTEHTAKNGKSVKIGLYLRFWPDPDEEYIPDVDSPRDPIELEERLAAEADENDDER